jgi:diaminopimelate epimerase
VRFSKYHGIGNDFVMLADSGDDLRLTPELVRALCDRRFGIGADGVIRVGPGKDGAELFMDYVNSDGSIGEMCGNGIRCLALFARAEGITRRSTIRVGTRAGLKVVEITKDRVRVDMGPPEFAPPDIPMTWHGANALHAKVELDDETIEVASLSMGNPHAVLFVDDLSKAPVTTLGPVIEHHRAWPKGTNVEFARVVRHDRVEARVWERVAGRTLACGTGACAVAVAARLLHSASKWMTIVLPGGELEVEWEGSLDRRVPVYLTGPAVKSFDGEVEVGDLISS